MRIRSSLIGGLLAVFLAWPARAEAPADAGKRLRVAASLGQGQSLVARLVGREAETPRATFRGRSVAMVRDGEAWLAVLAAPLELAPGSYPLVVEYREGGTLRSLQRAVKVREVGYPQQFITMAGRTAALYTSARARRERPVINAALRGETEEPVWRGRFSVPTSGRYSTAFGVRRVRNGRTAYRHRGIDIGAPKGRRIVAANDGEVRLARDLAVPGRAVVIDHGAGVTTMYMHMSVIGVREGDTVRRGQPIGQVGSTGASTGPHLHWGLYVRGVSVDPLQWVRDRSLARNDGG
jgi:murein DD-endopeptidase MepM/ murein hydrolase activator NlpD